MNFGGISLGMLRILGSNRVESAPPAASPAPHGCWSWLGISHVSWGQGRDLWRGRHNVELAQTDTGHRVCFQPSAMNCLTKGN